MDSAALNAVYSSMPALNVRLFEPYPRDVWATGQIAGDRVWVRCDGQARFPERVAVIAEGLQHWRVIAASVEALQDAVVRLVREILRTELALLGSFTMHAACAGSDGGLAVLFAGATGAGKTTLALELARSGMLISGDQTELLRDSAGQLLAVGFPWSIRVGQGTVRALGLDSVYPRVLLRSTREGPQPTASSGSDEKLEFTFDETKSLLGCAVHPAARLGCVVAVRNVSGLAAPTAAVVGADKGGDMLRAHAREPDPSFGPFWLPIGKQRPVEAQALQVLRDLVVLVPVVELQWSPRQHKAADALAALLAAVAPAMGAR